MPGTLYIVSLPIGNSEDITLRAIRILRNVAIIAAEDPGMVKGLFDRHKIATPITSYHRAVQEEKTAILLDQLQKDKTVALVSDEGTPTLCDPGTFLISRAYAAGIRIVPIPGVSAVLAGFSVSGFRGDAFTFMGTVPRGTQSRRRWLQFLRSESQHLVFFVSPKTLPSALQDLGGTVGNRRIVLVQDLTTPQEQCIRGRIAGVLAAIRKRPLQGKLTVIVEGKPKGRD